MLFTQFHSCRFAMGVPCAEGVYKGLAVKDRHRVATCFQPSMALSARGNSSKPLPAVELLESLKQPKEKLFALDRSLFDRDRAAFVEPGRSCSREYSVGTISCRFSRLARRNVPESSEDENKERGRLTFPGKHRRQGNATSHLLFR